MHYVLGFTQPLTQMSTRSRKTMFLGSYAQPVRRADKLTAIYEPFVQAMWDP
jgi:ABC-type cobalt transport system substrate-binding protein